jgi:hypothetical protein
MSECVIVVFGKLIDKNKGEFSGSILTWIVEVTEAEHSTAPSLGQNKATAIFSVVLVHCPDPCRDLSADLRKLSVLEAWVILTGQHADSALDAEYLIQGNETTDAIPAQEIALASPERPTIEQEFYKATIEVP